MEELFYSQVHYYIPSDILITCRPTDMHLRFFKLNTMLTNAFNNFIDLLINQFHQFQSLISNHSEITFFYCFSSIKPLLRRRACDDKKTILLSYKMSCAFCIDLSLLATLSLVLSFQLSESGPVVRQTSELIDIKKYVAEEISRECSALSSSATPSSFRNSSKEALEVRT